MLTCVRDVQRYRDLRHRINWLYRELKHRIPGFEARRTGI
jgi:hypothetical protein